jgi:hypothetical protein
MCGQELADLLFKDQDGEKAILVDVTSASGLSRYVKLQRYFGDVVHSSSWFVNECRWTSSPNLTSNQSVRDKERGKKPHLMGQRAIDCTSRAKIIVRQGWEGATIKSTKWKKGFYSVSI